MEQFPDDEHVKRLPEEIESHQQLQKRQLHESWPGMPSTVTTWTAASKSSKKLDMYLTPAVFSGFFLG